MAEADTEKSVAPSGSEPPTTVHATDRKNDEKDDTQSEHSSSTLRREASYPADATDLEAQAPEPATGPATRDTAQKDPYEVGWENGDSDPMNPRSMKKARKWLIVFITSFGCFAVTNASSVYTATYTQMNAEFGSSRLVATLGLSTFVLGIAFGPMWSPLSEFFGRRPIYLVSFALFVIWLIPSAVAKNIETMLIARFFQGFTGSAFLSVAGGTVGDLFDRHEMQAAMSVFTMAPFAGPSMGPLIGGFVNYHVNWRWTHYILIIWGFILFLALALFVPETYHPVLLRDKARKLRQETGNDRWKAPIEKSQKSIARTVGLATLRPFQLLIWEPICICLDLYSAVLLGILYLFFGAFPLVFTSNHGFNLWQVGLTFLGLLVGMMLATFTFPLWNRIRQRLIEQKEEETGIKGATEPEFRLPSVMFGAVLVPIGLFWFGWTTYASVHWILPIIGAGIFAAGTILAFSGIFTFFVDTYQLYAASALAANAFVRCIFAAAFPLFGLQMYEKLGYQWATSLLAFLAVGMLPFPFIFFKYGKRIRGHSRFATKG